MGSSTFTLIYDFLHDASAATSHLPWAYASLQHLSTMRAGDPITSTINAIQTVLRKTNPAYEWSAYTKATDPTLSETIRPLSQPPGNTSSLQPPSSGFGPSPTKLQLPEADARVSQWNMPPLGRSEIANSGGPSENLLDFTQSDMGWDFDFSTMDLEAFFSVYQPADATVP